MQPNVITLAVDILNSGTTTNQSYSRFEEAANRSTYVGATHSPASRDTLSLYRTPAKKTGNYLGSTKSAAKFSEDVVVVDAMGNDSVQPVILEVSWSVPVGVPAAKTKEIRQRAVALLDDDAIMSDLNDRGMI